MQPVGPVRVRSRVQAAPPVGFKNVAPRCVVGELVSHRLTGKAVAGADEGPFHCRALPRCGRRRHHQVRRQRCLQLGDRGINRDIGPARDVVD